MKILLINWRCIKNPEAGGAEIHMHEIFRRVAAMGHSVTLVAHHYKGAPREEIIDGIKVIRVGNKYLFNVQFKSYYKKNLADKDFDLVVDYITKIPLNTPKYIKKPLVAALMHIHGKSMFTELPFPLSLYVYLMEKGIPKYYKDTPVFVISPSTKKDLVATGYDEKKVEFLYSGIDQNLFNKKIEKNKIPSLLYIGRLKKYKNLQAIIDAMPLVIASIPDLTLDIAGCGDYEDALKKLVEEKKLPDKITFHGRVSEEKNVEMMGQAGRVVIMSMMEGWGIVVIESNAAGTPVIGSDVPGLRDSIVDGKTGILSPLNDTEKLAENIITLINDSDKLQKMSIEAEKWAEKFTWDAAAEHFIEVVKNKFPELKG
jgi:glycosyltransferase involved in cell wall biosynthesis